MQLSKYPALNNFEKQTSIPKVYVFLGIAAIYVFLVFFNIAGEFLVNFAGFIIPGYYSLDALFSVGKSDDTQVSFYALHRLSLSFGLQGLTNQPVADRKFHVTYFFSLLPNN